MTDHTVDYSNHFGRDEIHRLKDLLRQIDYKDSLTIVIDSNDAHDADPFLNVLDEYGFYYEVRSGEMEGKYSIVAKRKPH